MSRQVNRRDFLKHAGVAGAAVALAGCAPKQPTPAPTQAPASGGTAAKTFKKTKLVVPSWWGPHEIEGADKSFATTFKQQTGLDVKYEFVENKDYNAKVFTNLASDNPYDVITFNADFVPQYLDKDVLLPLNDLIARDKYDTANIVPSALEQWTYDGKIYGLTADMGGFHAYFNYDLFEKAGITPPKPTEDWTWDQLLEYAKKLTVKQGDQVVQYGVAVDVQAFWDVWPAMNGAHVFDEGVTKSLLDDPKAIEALAFCQRLVYDEGVALKIGSVKTSTNDLFIAGQLGILIAGTWRVGYMRSKKADMKYKWDVGMLPKGPSADKLIVPTFTAGWVLPKVAKDPDASWEAMKFYAGDTFAKDVMFVSLSGLPCTKSALEGAWFSQWPDNPPQGLTKEFYGKILDHAAARRHLRFNLGTEATAAMAKLDLIYSNEKKPAELLPQLAKEVTTALQNRPKK